MKNKKLFKLGLIGFAIGLLGLSFTSATIFELNLEKLNGILSPKAITDKMMYVHFADNGNDFGGFLYFSNNDLSLDEGNAQSTDESYNVSTQNDNSTNNDEYICRKQVKGFYYNSERGERLWPLDEDTKEAFGGEGLDMSGGIYTNCASAGYENAMNDCNQKIDTDGYEQCVYNVNEQFAPDGYGYYGELVHEYSGQEMKLVVGVNYDINPDFISIQQNSKLTPTFVRLQNKYPVGFIYDYNGGLGLAGCRFNSEDNPDALTGGSMKNLVKEVKDGDSVVLTRLFYYDETDGEMKYIGTIATGIECSPISEADSLIKIIFEGVLGVSNSGTTGALDFGTMGNSSDDKMQYFATKTVNNATMMNYARKKSESLCRGKWVTSEPNNKKSGIVCLNLSTLGASYTVNATSYPNGTTLIVKGGASVKVKSDIDQVYDIFVDGGNLLIDEESLTGEDKIYVINSWGYHSDELDITFKKCIVSGENCDNDCEDNHCIPNAAGVLRGNFIIDGNVKAKSEEDKKKLEYKYFIYGKFITNDNLPELEKMFGWRCNVNGLSSDGFKLPCSANEGNPYRNASLVVIDQNYNSPLLKG